MKRLHLPKQPSRVWQIWAVVIILVIVAAVVRVWNALTIVPEHFSGWLLAEEIVNWMILFPLAAPAFTTAGVVILARHPGNLIAWLCVATGIILVFQDIFWQFTLRAATDGWLGIEPLAILTVWFSAPNIPPLPLIILLLRFPDGLLLSPRWRWIERLAVGSALAQVIAGTFYTQLTVGLPEPRENPLGSEALEGVISVLMDAGIILSMVSLGMALLAMMIRRKRAVGQARQQLKWLAFASGWLLVLVFLTFLFYPVDQAIGSLLYMSTVAVGTVGIPVALGVAMLKYRLYDVDLVINRALVYSILTAILGLVYAGSVMLLQGASRLLTGEQSNLAIVTSSLMIAALFNPLRRRVQVEIDRRFYRRQYDAAQVLAAFSIIARDEVDLERLKDRLLEVVAETMQPAHLSLWLRDTGDGSSRPADHP